MAINWFPGHMNKARREIRKVMGKVQLIIEVLDARIPFSSENPLVSGLRRDTPCIKVLNKRDLADPRITNEWLAYFRAQKQMTAIAVHKGETKKIKKLLDIGKKMLPKDRSQIKATTAMILGIPNVGKSTLINILAGRTIAKTGNVPAVTKRQQQVLLKNNIVLLDTPGFLWPKLTPKSCGYRLAITGAIKDAVIEYPDIAGFAADYFLKACPESLKTRYKLSSLPADGEQFLLELGRRRGCMAKGGVVNVQKASEILIREYRQGLLGPISLEAPADIAREQQQEK